MIEEASAEFERTQRELTAQTKENTNLLNLIRKLGEEELELDKRLNDSNKAIFVDEDEEKRSTSWRRSSRSRSFWRSRPRKSKLSRQKSTCTNARAATSTPRSRPTGESPTSTKIIEL